MTEAETGHETNGPTWTIVIVAKNVTLCQLHGVL